MKIDDEKQEILSNFSAESLAQYIAGRTGERVARCNGGFRVGSGKNGAGSISIRSVDGVAVAHDFAETGCNGDVLSVIQYYEGCAFSEAIQRASNMLGNLSVNTVFCDSMPKDAQSENAKTSARVNDFLQRYGKLLEDGLDTEEARNIVKKRRLNDVFLANFERFGFVAGALNKTVLGDIPRNSFVFWDSSNRLKFVEFNQNTGKRTGNIRNLRGCGECVWTPREKTAADKYTLFCEGEFDAYALCEMGFFAISCKPTSSNENIFKVCKNGVLCFDYDDAGREYSKKAKQINNQLIDISRIWGEGCDPNDFVSCNEDAREKILKAIETTMIKTTDTGKNAPLKTRRQRARAFFSEWRYDEFYEEFYDPNGNAYNMDCAAALCVRNFDDVSKALALEMLETEVKCNPSRSYDALKERVLKLAKECKHRGAIDAYASRCCFNEYETRRLKLWLYQVCGRALMPGEKTDSMLVLVSQAEGMHKTSFFDGISRALTEKKRTAASYDFREKSADRDLKLVQNCIVCIDEIDAVLKKTDVAEIKEKITATSSYTRAPYERAAKMRLNRAVFGATSNDVFSIPSGEDGARRYWMIELKKDIAFLSSAEAEAIVAEACKAVVDEVNSIGGLDKIDHERPEGKAWIESNQEKEETISRNKNFKHADASTISIKTALWFLSSELKNNKIYNEIYSASQLAAAFSTGNAEILGIHGLKWDAPQSKAADICRLIVNRCKKTSVRVNGCPTSGYKLLSIIDEFYPLAKPIDQATNVCVGDNRRLTDEAGEDVGRSHACV